MTIPTMNHAEPRRTGRIDTPGSLRTHLQWAIELEHATLPSYLCALYSLDPSRNPEAVQVVGSVFVEEMIHLSLAANLLNAVGGHPRLDTPRMLPRYPRHLPHGDRSLELSLVPLRYQRGDTPQSGPTGEALPVDLGGVHPMRRNPRLADHSPGSPIRAAQEDFNRTYCAVLHLLERAFNGSPKMLGVAIGTMYALKAQAQALMEMPDGDGTTAGPTFDYVRPERPR